MAGTPAACITVAFYMPSLPALFTNIPTVSFRSHREKRKKKKERNRHVSQDPSPKLPIITWEMLFQLLISIFILSIYYFLVCGRNWEVEAATESEYTYFPIIQKFTLFSKVAKIGLIILLTQYLQLLLKSTWVSFSTGRKKHISKHTFHLTQDFKRIPIWRVDQGFCTITECAWTIITTNTSFQLEVTSVS